MSKPESVHPTSVPEKAAETLDNQDEPTFGWNAYSELVNGRLAMLAVLGVVLLEWFTKQDLFTWLGLR